MNQSRTRLLVGTKGMDKFAGAGVAVFGLGGVGSFALEALVRAGVGRVFILDCDSLEPSNINRQLLALHSTMSMKKVKAATERMKDINRNIQIISSDSFLDAGNVDSLLPDGIHYAVDAIDTVESKAALLEYLYHRQMSFVSCMGSAKKLSPLGIKVDDISKTRKCPLARLIRKKLRTRGITAGIRCVYSDENIVENSEQDNDFSTNQVNSCTLKKPLGSISYLPGIIGLTAAGIILNDILLR